MYHIIAEKFKGRITDSDLHLLNDWLDASPENKEIYAELEKVWKLTGECGQMVNADVDREWTKFVNKRDALSSAGLNFKSSRSSWKLLYRYAAILLPIIMLASIAFYFVPDRNNQKNWITAAAQENRINMTLPDGTEVWLNRNSVLRYPKSFGSRERLVYIDGEAFFKVAKTGSRFKVDAGSTTVQVLGTRFNVNNYKGDSLAQVVVEEGRVLFSEKSRKRNNVNLTAGDIGTFRGLHVPITRKAAANHNASAWVSQKLTFNNASLTEVKRDIEHYFSIKMVISKNLENCLFSGEFSNPQAENVLDIVALSTGSRLRCEDHIFYLEGGSCNN
jgi:transmembrane sensor